jgi:hypothetical protein
MCGHLEKAVVFVNQDAQVCGGQHNRWAGKMGAEKNKNEK